MDLIPLKQVFISLSSSYALIITSTDPYSLHISKMVRLLHSQGRSNHYKIHINCSSLDNHSLVCCSFHLLFFFNHYLWAHMTNTLRIETRNKWNGKLLLNKLTLHFALNFDDSWCKLMEQYLTLIKSQLHKNKPSKSVPNLSL